MPYSLEDLPTIESAGRIGRRPSGDSPTLDAYQDRYLMSRRRRVPMRLGVGMRLATALQERRVPGGIDIAAMEVAAVSYNTYADCATQPDYNGACGSPCWGFAPEHMAPFYCGTCAEQAADPANNPDWNWHFVGTRGSIKYMDREPDVCAGKDAWKWKITGTCGNCSNESTYRCHDGYKKYANSSSWTSTICEGLVSCDGQLTTC